MTEKICYAWGVMPGRSPIKPTPAFGARLAALRQERGWTQAALAKRLGLTVKMVTYYEREASNPTAKTVAKLAEVFGVEPAAFLDGAQSQRAAKPGPPSGWEKRIAAIKQLSRGKQQKIAEVVEALLKAS
jgi:transcriptional regulator with XRE-family HTH domain